MPNKKEDVIINDDVMTKKIKNALEALKIQYKDHSEKSDGHKFTATKALGAIEVLTQLTQEEVGSDS